MNEPNKWTCDQCGGPLIGGIWYPHAAEQWCEDCHADAFAGFVDRREYMANLLREQQEEREVSRV